MLGKGNIGKEVLVEVWEADRDQLGSWPRQQEVLQGPFLCIEQEEWQNSVSGPLH